MKSLDGLNSLSIKRRNILLAEAAGQGKSLLSEPRARLAFGCGSSWGQWCSCRGMTEGVTDTALPATQEKKKE
jgi:hypothetical protein